MKARKSSTVQPSTGMYAYMGNQRSTMTAAVAAADVVGLLFVFGVQIGRQTESRTTYRGWSTVDRQTDN
jgi:hypothetical protein